MMVENTSKVQGIHRKKRIKLGWPIMAVVVRRDFAGHKYSRIELQCATMTVEIESCACGMQRKGTMELGCPIINVERESQVSVMQYKSRMELRYSIEIQYN